MKKLMWLEKGIINHNTMKWVWYLVGVVKLWTWFVVAPKISFEKLATMDYPPYLVQFPTVQQLHCPCKLWHFKSGEKLGSEPNGKFTFCTSQRHHVQARLSTNITPLMVTISYFQLGYHTFTTGLTSTLLIPMQGLYQCSVCGLHCKGESLYAKIQ